MTINLTGDSRFCAEEICVHATDCFDTINYASIDGCHVFDA
jgi:hypothetical protein